VDNIQETILSVQERKRLRNKAILEFYKKGKGYTMDQICEISRKKPEWFYSTSGLSKTTVFFAVNGRSKKKPIKK